MADILQIFSIERRLLGPDAIPWAYLLAGSNLQRLRERYKFQNILQQPNPAGAAAGLVGSVGEYQFADTIEVIDQLVLEPTVMQVQITGRSERADKFLDDVAHFFSEIDPKGNFAKVPELARTYQTIAIVKLTIPFESFVSEPFRRYLSEAAWPKFALPKATAEIALEHLSWSVKYKMQTTDFMYMPKTFTLEPRQGSPAAEMQYYTVSPTDSETHLAILRDLEKAMTKDKRSITVKSKRKIELEDDMS